MESSSVIILGDSLEPETVTAMLALEPDQCWRNGQRKSFRRQNGEIHFFDSVHEWGGWKLWSSELDQKNDLCAQIENWLTLLTPRKDALRKLRDSGCDIVLDCILIGEAENIQLSNTILQRLADIGLTLNVSFSAHSDEEPNQ